MSISAMKQALEALEDYWKVGPQGTDDAIAALRQAIEQAEKQEIELLNVLARILPFVDCCVVITPEDFREYESALADAEAAIAKASGGEE